MTRNKIFTLTAIRPLKFIVSAITISPVFFISKGPSGYVVVRAPVGAKIATLPNGYTVRWSPLGFQFLYRESWSDASSTSTALLYPASMASSMRSKSSGLRSGSSRGLM